MKKIIALVLALLMLSATMVSCGDKTNPEETTVADETTATPIEGDETSGSAEELAYANALELINILYEKYNEAQTSDDTKLAVIGGNINNYPTCNAEAPALFDAIADEDYNQNLGIPVAEVEKFEAVASMSNMMNANVFNCFTIQLKADTDVDAFIQTLKDNILARQWICGAPEKLVIAKAPGNYIVAVWGVVNDGGIVNPFVESFSTSINGIEVVVDHTFAA